MNFNNCKTVAFSYVRQQEHRVVAEHWCFRKANICQSFVLCQSFVHIFNFHLLMANSSCIPTAVLYQMSLHPERWMVWYMAIMDMAVHRLQNILTVLHKTTTLRWLLLCFELNFSDILFSYICEWLPPALPTLGSKILTCKTFLPPPRRICDRHCLSVCWQLCIKNFEWICMKFLCKVR